MAAFFIASLGIIGIPPAGGTWSKWYLLMGSLNTEQWTILVILILSSLLNIAYLLPIPIRAFLFKESTANPALEIKEAPLACLIAIGITTVGIIALFMYPAPLYDLASSILQTSSIAHGQ